MLNDHQLTVARLRIERLTQRALAGDGPIDPHAFARHQAWLRHLAQQLSGTRKHLHNVAWSKKQVVHRQGHKHAANISRGKVKEVERSVARFVLALAHRAPNRPQTWEGVKFGTPVTTQDISAEVMTGKGVLNVVQKTMKMFDQASLTTEVRHDFNQVETIFRSAQPQQFDTLTGLLILAAALLETLRLQGFLKRSA